MTVFKTLLLLLPLVFQCLLSIHRLSVIREDRASATERAAVVTVIGLADIAIYILWRCLIRPRFSILRDLPQPSVRPKAFVINAQLSLSELTSIHSLLVVCCSAMLEPYSACL